MIFFIFKKLFLRSAYQNNLKHIKNYPNNKKKFEFLKKHGLAAFQVANSRLKVEMEIAGDYELLGLLKLAKQ